MDDSFGHDVSNDIFQWKSIIDEIDEFFKKPFYWTNDPWLQTSILKDTLNHII